MKIASLGQYHRTGCFPTTSENFFFSFFSVETIESFALAVVSMDFSFVGFLGFFSLSQKIEKPRSQAVF